MIKKLYTTGMRHSDRSSRAPSEAFITRTLFLFVAGLGACAARPAGSSALVTASAASPEPTPTKGGIRETQLRYRGGAIAVLGSRTGNVKVGCWTILYPSGRLLLDGTYDSEGRLDGPWRLFAPNGDVDMMSRTLQSYEGGADMVLPAGHSYWELDQLETSDRMMWGHMWPLRGWNGSGLYEHGVWAGSLPDESMRSKH